VATYVAVFALVLAYLALVAAYVALRTLAKVRRATALLARGTRSANGRESLLEATSRHAELAMAVAEQIEQLRSHVDATHEDVVTAVAGQVEADAAALRHVALVRYDAFVNMSGRMSFSLALLDDHGDGVTLSALAGTSDTRVYAKAVAGGKGEHELSPEEAQAVASALARRRVPLLTRRAS
jgi:hypothetical protein